MQPKVSIVIPCYNKEKWIGGMFDSILAQEWDNIELILVNDGSTDDTRNIIAEYEPKFISRGYEVVIIDQENQGVAASVRNGLIRLTGEYVCQVDADDELDPRYVSMMAGWLDKNKEYDWTACDMILVRENSTAYIQVFPNGVKSDCNIERILLSDDKDVWIYMIRSSYLRHCKVVELFYTGRDCNQEPQLFIPLLWGRGKIKHFREPLYRYNRCEFIAHRSYRDSYEKAKQRWYGFIQAFNEIINTTPFNEKYKKKLCAISELQHSVKFVQDASVCRFSPQNLASAINNLLKYVRLYYKPNAAINSELAHRHYLEFCVAVKDNILNNQPKKFNIPSGRIIAWGALGRIAAILLPNLKDTEFEPNELWDSAGDDVKIKKPDLGSLAKDDLVLVLPTWNGGITEEIKMSSCDNIILLNDILTYLAAKIFPIFYNGSIKFSP